MFMGESIKSTNSSAQHYSQSATCSLKTSRKKHTVLHIENTGAETFAVSRKIESINRQKATKEAFCASSQANFLQLDAINKHELVTSFNDAVAGIDEVQKVSPNSTDPLETYKKNFKTAFEAKSQLKSKSSKTNTKQPNFEEMRSQLGALKAQAKKITAQLETTTPSDAKSKTKQLKISEVYFRFFKLLARIIEQAEGDAYSLYKSAKERTDQCDKLNLLYGQLLGTTGKVDWSNDAEMKKLIDEAKALGVVVPDHKGTYKFSEEQKKNLIENIRTKKDSLDKLTQMEKTDLQRYMQIATNGHEWRSNLLKMWESAARTIVRNFAAG